MAIKDVFKVNRKTFVDPNAWLGYDTVKTETKGVWSLFRAVFRRPAKPVREESFEQAVKRLHLTEKDIKEAQDTYFFYAMIFAMAGAVILLVAFYLIFNGHFLGFLLGMAVGAVMLAHAFRNHFLYFQIKHRKLGCTFEEWRRGRPT
jgi:intracellular multiplication protein IcmV